MVIEDHSNEVIYFMVWLELVSRILLAILPQCSLHITQYYQST